MTEDRPGEERREPPHDAPDVGSVGEEAAKLFGALADMARQQGASSAASGLGGLAGQAASLAHELNEHIATDSAECRYCPVCRAVHLVRQTTPEVRAHLVTAASSLLQAAAGLMETIPPPEGGTPRGPEVERIDLDDPDDPDDAPRPPGGDDTERTDPGE
jgi:hypothetical protein